MSRNDDYQNGMAAFVATEYEEAIPHLQAASAGDDQESRIARYYLGQAHDRLGRRLLQEQKNTRAAGHLSTAAKLTPHGPDLAAYLAQCYAQTEQFDVAAHELERLLVASPHQVGTRVRLAFLQFKAGETWRAVATLRDGLSAQPGAPELHYQLGVMMATLDDTAEAQVHFEAAIAADPSHARACERLAQCCAVQGRSERALRYLERAHRIEPGNARIAWQLVLAAGQSPNRVTLTEAVPHHDAAAVQRLADAILREPDFIESFLSLPASAVDPDVFRMLAATLESALRNHAEYADLHYHCGRIYRRLGTQSSAIEHAERAVAINPAYVNALILLAELYGQTNRHAEGVERLDAAIHAGGDYPDVHYLIGRLCQNAGDMKRARQEFERAIEMNENYREARVALAALAA